jgi:anthranilate phosphoribosyltransferase
VLGVFGKEWVEPLAQVLKRLGSRHVLVVHAEDGLDEISIAGPTHIAELKDGDVRTYTVEPGQFGLKRGSLAELKVGDAAASLAMIRHVFDNRPGAPRDIVALNAGAAIYASGIADSLAAGVERAAQALADGSAKAKLGQLIAVSAMV